ncbi:hypothetical protein EC2872000_3556 [Escherichia coli 2872000]|nr:hypothetical protein EC2872000_3556 [Escherichia coli 2872000]EMV54964.1 hypothetical protein EC2871950_3444 [Escherichia coli 2871950]ESA67900.1 hypothetical protein HMPREF1589_03309 [Escherichia coli 113290]
MDADLRYIDISIFLTLSVITLPVHINYLCCVLLVMCCDYIYQSGEEYEWYFVLIQRI